MANYTDNLPEKEQLDYFAEIFESKSVGLVNECYLDNPINTKNNLIRKLHFYGKSTCFELAAEGNSINFIGHKSCQELLEQIWKHSMDDGTKLIQIVIYLLFGILCPLLIPFLVHYKHNFYVSEEEQQELNAKSKKSRESSIDDSDTDMNAMSFFDEVSLKHYKFTLKDVRIYQRKILDFYSTPIIKFSYAMISYVAYLSYFTTMLLTRLQVTSISLDFPFIFLIIWTLTLGFEELRQAFSSGLSFNSYVSNIWNKFDVFGHSFFIIATICYAFSQLDYVANFMIFALVDLRPIGAIRQTILRISRFCYGFSIFFFIFRIMQVFSIDSNLGPKVVMIQSMINKDLGPFIAIIIVFILSYSVLMWSVAFQVQSTRALSDLPRVIFEMFRTSYFQILGELRLDVLMNNASCTANNSMCDDDWGKWFSPILLAIYIVLTTVLLLNLLVTMFSNTYEIIQSSSNQYWTLQRYQLMREYTIRPPIPPPLIIIWQIYYFLSKCLTMNMEISNPFNISYKGRELKEKQLIQWERMRSLDYLRANDENNPKKKKSQVIVLNQGNSAAAESMGNIKRDLDSMKENVNERLSERICLVENRLQRLDVIEVNLDEVSQLIQQLKLYCIRNKDSVDEYLRTNDQSESSWTDVTYICDDENHESPIQSNNDSINLQVFIIGRHFVARLVPIFNNKKLKISKRYSKRESIENPWSKRLLSAVEHNKDEMLPLPGTNKCIHLIITRSRTEENDDSGREGKSILEIVAIKQEEHMMELPFFLVEHTSSCFQELCITDLIDEIIQQNFLCDDRENSKIEKGKLLEHDFQSYKAAIIKEIHRGFIDDVRNTEKSWVETVAFNVHQTVELSFSDNYLKMLIQHKSESACWVESSNEMWKNPGNTFLIKKVKEMIDI